MGTKRRRVTPTGRDLAILHYLGTRGVESEQRLISRFWPASTSPRTGCDRLSQLVASGLVGRERVRVRCSEETIYHLVRGGSLLLPSSERKRLITRRPPYGELSHLLKTSELLDRLDERYGLVLWHGERLLKAQKSRVEGGGQVADLWVELSQPLLGKREWHIEIDGAYFGQRLADKIAALGDGGEATLWVCYSRSRMAHLAKRAAPFPSLRFALAGEV